MNLSDRKQAVLLFLLLFFCYAFIHQGMGWNQNSRLDLLHGLVIHKTFNIDAHHENTGDKSYYRGHYYSDKAPGIAFLAIPAFTVSVGVLNMLDIPLNSPRGWRASSWMATLGSVGLVTALGGVAFFFLVSRFVGRACASMSVMVTFLGAAPFPYATMLFSHAAVMALFSIALWAIADDLDSFIRKFTPLSERPVISNECRAPRLHTGRFVIAGFCCGLAIASEYTAAVAAGGVLLLESMVNVKRAMILAVAAFFPLLLIFIYNGICFGGPLSFGYHHLALAEFQEMNKGLFGITFPPKLSAVYLIVFSPERGLLFWTPFFLMALLGFNLLRKKAPALTLVAAGVIIAQVICISGYYLPSGGAALGPRHLAPIIPFVALFAAVGFERFPRIGCVLGYYSLILTVSATVIDATTPDKMANPLISFYLPKLEHGEFTTSLGEYLGLSKWFSSGLLFFAVICIYLLFVSGIRVGSVKPRQG